MHLSLNSSQPTKVTTIITTTMSWQPAVSNWRQRHGAGKARSSEGDIFHSQLILGRSLFLFWDSQFSSSVFTTDENPAMMPAFISMLRRGDSCIGWHCLTAAEQFGVVFSSVTVFLVVSLTYMYCLGKAVAYRRSRESAEPSQHMNSGVINRHAAATVQLVPLTGQYPAGTLLGPNSHNQVAAPFAQPYMTSLCFQGIPVAASTNRRDDGHPIPKSQQPERRRGTVDADVAGKSHSPWPRWRQLHNRIPQPPLPPLGKACTVYSESNPPSPTSIVELKGSQSGVRSTECHSTANRHDDAEADSVTTTAATVHSDDFQMLGPPSSTDL